MAWALVALLLAASHTVRPALPAVPAAAATPEVEPRAWTLEAFTAAAQAADPRAVSAAAEVARLRAVEAEVHARRGPALDWVVQVDGPVPELRNDPNRLDSVSSASRLRNGEWAGIGLHGHVGASFAWPVWTFGRAEA